MDSLEKEFPHILEVIQNEKHTYYRFRKEIKDEMKSYFKKHNASQKKCSYVVLYYAGNKKFTLPIVEDLDVDRYMQRYLIRKKGKKNAIILAQPLEVDGSLYEETNPKINEQLFLEKMVNKTENIFIHKIPNPNTRENVEKNNRRYWGIWVNIIYQCLIHNVSIDDLDVEFKSKNGEPILDDAFFFSVVKLTGCTKSDLFVDVDTAISRMEQFIIKLLKQEMWDLDLTYADDSDDEYFALETFYNDDVLKLEYGVYVNAEGLSLSYQTFKRNLFGWFHFENFCYMENKEMNRLFFQNLYAELESYNRIDGISGKEIKITYKDFMVSSQMYRCISNGHNAYPVTAKVDVMKQNGDIIEASTKCIYCEKCKTGYILEDDFYELKKQGVLLCRVENKTKIFDKKNANFSYLRTQSDLRECGYTVSANENLSDKQRIEILNRVIINKIMTPQQIVAFLDWLIHRNSTKKNFQDAIRKWRHDRDYVKNNGTSLMKMRISKITIK